MIDIVIGKEKDFELGKKLGFSKVISIDERFVKNPDRREFEKRKDIVAYNLEDQKRDFIHYRNSGLNQVLCKLAKKNNIAIAFNFNLILNSEGMLRSQLLGRMMQNIKFCRKYKVNMVIGSFASKPEEMRSAHDLISFGISIGMHPKEAKESLKYIENL